MKKLVSTIIVLTLASFAFAKGFSLTNTIGGCEGNLPGGDLFTFPTTKTSDSFGYTIAERLQADYSNKVLTARLRFDASYSNLDLYQHPDYSTEDKYFFPKGYIAYNPITQFGIALGNGFFSQFGSPCGTLYAMDDIPSYGKLLKSGVGLYTTIPLADNSCVVKAGAGLEYPFPIENSEYCVLSGGVEFGYKDFLDFAVTGRNLTSNNRRFAVLAGISPKNFSANAGFVYNNRDDDLLLENVKYSLVASAAYNKDLFGISADFITGLTNERINSSGETKVYKDKSIPYTFVLRGQVNPMDSLELGLTFKLMNLMNVNDAAYASLYPNAQYKFNKKFTLNGGLRFNFGSAGLTDVAVPLTFKCKFKF